MNNVSNLTDRHDENVAEHGRTSPKAGHYEHPASGSATGALTETDAQSSLAHSQRTIDSDTMTSRENQAEEDQLYFTGLVFGRAILEQRGAGDADLAWMTTEIAKLRTRLADEQNGQYTTANREAQASHALHHPPQPSAPGVALRRLAS
jgi:hypothetical protein